MKLIDGFIFYNELDLLTIRLEELYDVVDYFILVEGTLTFTGNHKPLYYQENKEQFKKYHDKIIHIIVDDYPTTTNPWDREIYQRRAIVRGMEGLHLASDDCIMISDADEIPNSDTLLMIKNGGFLIDRNVVYALLMTLYYYHYEWTVDRLWMSARLLTYYQYSQLECDSERVRHYMHTYIERGGWHLSYFGTTSFIVTKLESFSEQQDNTSKNKDDAYLTSCIQKGILHFNNEPLIAIPRHTNRNLPKPVLRSFEKQIPSIGFTFWEGKQLSILQYTTLLSFSTYNPTCRIKLYYSDKVNNFVHSGSSDVAHTIHASGFNFGEDKCISIDQLRSIPRLEIIPIDVEAECKITFQTSPIHKADIVRIVKLYEHGGIWFDMDVLFIKPVPPSILQGTKDVYYFSYADTIATGLIASTPRNPAIAYLYEQCAQKISTKDMDNEWQQFGPNLWKKCVNACPSLFLNSVVLDNDEIYPYLWYESHLFFFTNENRIKEHTWGIHWYNGNIDSRRFIDSFTFRPDTIDKDASVFHRYLHQLYHF